MSAEPNRHQLPIAEVPRAQVTAFDARAPYAGYPPLERLLPPSGAPNVLVIMLDDVGFAASSPFGGPCETPTAERLAAGGLRFNRFHTTALCAPTRQALLTGRNHHSVGMGALPETATSSPGYNGLRPLAAATLAETLRLNGYATAQLGKCHEVPDWERGPAGPFDRWPTNSGFEYFFGFVAGETDQYSPCLVDGTRQVEPHKTPEEGYHLTEDLADRAIAWLRQLRTQREDTPFFLYFAPGATHGPHHVPAEWSDKYAGRFDDGWDLLRERIVSRQRQLGIIPEDAQLTDRSEDLPPWDEMPEALKPVLARQMEVYAGFLEHTDFHIGRIIDALSELGMFDDTLVYYIIGDNGGSGEGGANGVFSETSAFNGVEEPVDFVVDRIDLLGTPDANGLYSACWGHALNTPYQWTKQVASHWGGTRVGTVVHWPNGISARGEIRSQFHHVIDVAATVLDVAGLPAPTTVYGVTQQPLHGTSMRYAFDGADAPEARTTQYFEIVGNRGIYHDGWTAVAPHRIPWHRMRPVRPLEDDVWELYAPDDWSQARDLAEAEPERLRELQRLFLIEAAKYGVLPLDDRLFERMNAAVAGRPQAATGDSQFFFGDVRRMPETSVLNLKNCSYAVTAEVTVPVEGARGVLVCQGGRFGGWTLYAGATGELRYAYNFTGIELTEFDGGGPLPKGTHQVRVEFDYDGGGPGRGGAVTLYVDGRAVGEAGRLERTHAAFYSFADTFDIGTDTGTRVTRAYPEGVPAFTGTVHWVQIDLGNDSEDHLVSPRLRMAALLAAQ